MITFVETRLFTRLVSTYLGVDEYCRLQMALQQNPEAGDVIPGSGGIRKLRWAAKGRGKRGGYRVIYCNAPLRGAIWLLTIYPKGVADDIPAHILRRIRKEVDSA